MRLATILLTVALAGPVAADQLDPSPDSIPPHARVIKQNSKAFMACYQRELSRDPRTARGGKVVLAVVLDKVGAVKSVKVESTTLDNRNVENCLLREMLKLRFPAEAPATFSFPFVFAAA